MADRNYKYADDPVWTDVTPIEQDDGGSEALATIAYADGYREASSYLRAVMAAGESSERALALTANVIELNPAHYTVWLYRAGLLKDLDKSIPDEMEWLNDISLRHIKNYQIWHHRQILIDRWAARQPELFPSDTASGSAFAREGPIASELEFLATMLSKDAKNYHVWSYRHWLVRRFSLWTGFGEVEECERFLRLDVRNNSAWNHRWFVVFGREKAGVPLPADAWQTELEYVQEAIRVAPQNESAWNYLRGLMRKERRPWSEQAAFAKEFTGDLKDEAAIRSTFALDFLADAAAEDPGSRPVADAALTLLADRFDPIRKDFWNHRRKVLGLQTT